jgi:hypothetical protein
MLIPDAIPVSSFLLPFWRNVNSSLDSTGMEISILAGTTAKNSVSRNDRNWPDSTGFWQEYMEDSKDLGILDELGTKFL